MLQPERKYVPALSLAFLLLYTATASPMPQSAPNFELRDQEGKKRQLSDFRGQGVLLNFWATWCPPCRVEIPWLQQVHKKYADRGFTVLGVAMDERGWRAVTPFVRQYGIRYPILLGNAKVARLYGGLETLPKTLFLDREGRIIAEHDALIGPEHLERIVETILADNEQIR